MALQLKNYDPALMQGASIDINLDLAEILDPAGNEMLEFDQVASAVNFLRLANSASGNPVVLSSQGDDTNVGLDLFSKGTGSVRIISDSLTGNAVDVLSGTITGGAVIDLSDADALTTGRIINAVSNSSSTSTRSLVRIVNDNGAASGTSPLEIQQDGTLAAIRLSGSVQKGIDLSAISGTGFNIVAGYTTDSPPAVATAGYLKILISGGTAKYIRLWI